MQNAYTAKAYSAASETSRLAADTIPRRNPTDRDVQIEILFCGVCHSDLHQVRNEWREAMPTVYPCVPGHEIVGRVTKVGSAVMTYKPGDLVAVEVARRSGPRQGAHDALRGLRDVDAHLLQRARRSGRVDAPGVEERLLEGPARCHLVDDDPLDEVR